MSQKINIRERRYNGVDYDILHPETNINMVLDSSNNSVGDVKGALYGDGNGNIVGASISNPNLLDNPWFTVNQRGWTSGASTNRVYCVDRWKMSYGSNAGTIAIGSSGITLTPATSDRVDLFQMFEDDVVNGFLGKTLTASIMFSNGSIITGTATLTSLSSNLAFITDVDGMSCFYQSVTKSFRFYATQEVTIRAVKLELGSVSTLANDVAPNYDLELIKCQRYFKRYNINGNGRLTIGWIASTSHFMCMLNFNDVPMRADSTISTGGSFSVELPGGTSYTLTSIVINDVSKEYVNLRGEGATYASGDVGKVAILRGVSAYIDLSADL